MPSGHVVTYACERHRSTVVLRGMELWWRAAETNRYCDWCTSDTWDREWRKVYPKVTSA